MIFLCVLNFVCGVTVGALYADRILNFFGAGVVGARRLQARYRLLDNSRCRAFFFPKKGQESLRSFRTVSERLAPEREVGGSLTQRPGKPGANRVS